MLELDVTDQDQLDSLADRVSEHVEGLDGVLHSIGFAPASCLGEGVRSGNFRFQDRKSGETLQR